MVKRIKKYNSEDNLHEQVATYLKLQYPKVIFRTDFAAGIKLTPGQAVKHKKLQSRRSYPDLFIAQGKKSGKMTEYHGQFIELKKEGAILYKKDGSISESKHIQEQYETLVELTALGYYANFAQGFEEAKRQIDWYLGEDK